MGAVNSRPNHSKEDHGGDVIKFLHFDQKNEVLMRATSNGRLDIMEILLKFEPTAVNSTCPEGLTPLMIASQKGDVTALEFLIERGSVVDKRDMKHWTAVMHGAHSGNLASVEALGKHGADVNICDHNGCTPLMIASAQGHLKVVSFLVKGVVTLDSVDSDGMTAFMHAAKVGHLSVMNELLNQKKSTDKNLSDRNGFTALIWASIEGHISIVKFLIEMGCDVDAVDHEGWTALMHGVLGNHFEVVTLLAPCANVNVKSKMGYSALMLACVINNKSVVEKLLGVNNCAVDVVDYMGWTPLMHAVVEGNYESVKRLCCHNANVVISCPAGMTASRLARVRNDIDLLDLLVQYGGCSEDSKAVGVVVNPSVDNNAGDKVVHSPPLLRKRQRVEYVTETISRSSLANNELNGCSRFKTDEDIDFEIFLSQLNLSEKNRRSLLRDGNGFQKRRHADIWDWMSRNSGFRAAAVSFTSNSFQRKSSIQYIFTGVQRKPFFYSREQCIPGRVWN